MKSLKERADEIIALVNYIKDELSKDPTLGDFIEDNYPDVIQTVTDKCKGCGSIDFQKIKQSKDGTIYECSDCPEKTLQ